MQRLTVCPLSLSGLSIIQRTPIEDARGYFERVFCVDELRLVGFDKPIKQINRSYTKNKGMVRGLHFQYSPHAEVKLISCLRGEVFDVAVDLRRDSPTFLRWHGEILSAENHKSLLVPEGFAHGFQALSGDCELLYLHTAEYVADSQGGVHPEDGRLRIQWPLRISGISERDLSHPRLSEEFVGLK